MPYVDIALNLPIDKVFCYFIPEDGSIGQRIRKAHIKTKKKSTPPDQFQPAEPPLTGRRVEVRFAGRRLTGFITDERSAPPADLPAGTTIQRILRFVDMAPVCPPETLELARWLSWYYFCSLGQAPLDHDPPGKRGTATVSRIPTRDSGANARTSFRSTPDRVRPFAYQERHPRKIRTALSPARRHGKRKDEVYRHLARMAVEGEPAGRDPRPRDRLTPQTIGRFASIFPGQIAVLHSQLSPAERIGNGAVC